MPVMQEMLRMRDAGQLDETQAQWFRTSKAEEELFDIASDPFELNNLAGDASYADKLAELRNELDSWMSGIDDKGLMPEAQLITSMWPNGVQPTTLTPIPSKAESGGALTLSSETEGASIGYQILNEGDELGPTWQIYQVPLSINEGERVVAIAHRIGFIPSSTVTVR
jgi:hypothetical protein